MYSSSVGLAINTSQEPAPPPHRSLQIYAFDPSLDLDLETARVNRAVINVPWEADLSDGPVGAYLEVIDVDPATGCAYGPVNLNHSHLLAQSGLSPSEGNPQFHQQMVYAVAMKTISNFERALGRSVHWSPRWLGRDAKPESTYVARLRIYPHALREANAYYSPDKKALLFGYFNSLNTDSREGLPGGMIFTCLSHDVIAHEMTHAILDGIHRRMIEATNPDSLAFHEAFADLIAIFQHFTLPGVLEQQIAVTRGDLATENLLAKLALQFGRATKRGNALRDALGDVDPETGRWCRARLDPARIERTFEPHARGAILVAAVFHAFLTIYRSHTADLFRLATGGTGNLPDGAIHPDLVARLAAEAEKVAQRMLNMCIRALDYLPPVDVTFGDYVRALITADVDLVPDDTRHYRVALISALRDWGIYPRDVRVLAVESLRWTPLRDQEPLHIRDQEPLARQKLLEELLPSAPVLRAITNATGFIPYDHDTATDRVALSELAQKYVMSEQTEQGSNPSQRRRHEFLRERQFAAQLHDFLKGKARRLSGPELDAIKDALGLDLRETFEVHAVRPTTRVRADGRTKTELLILMTQSATRQLPADEGNQDDIDPADADTAMYYRFRGGCTLLIDPESGLVQYVIAKSVGAEGRRRRQETFLLSRLDREGVAARGRYGVWENAEEKRKVPQEPFRMLHRGEAWDDET